MLKGSHILSCTADRDWYEKNLQAIAWTVYVSSFLKHANVMASLFHEMAKITTVILINWKIESPLVLARSAS